MKARGNRISLVAILLSIIFCVAVLARTGYAVHTYTKQESETAVSPIPDGNVKMGILSNPEGCQRELDAMVEEEMLTLSVNATPFMANGTGKANLYIENPPASRNRFTVMITRDDTREETCRPGYLDPEQYIDEATLDVKLSKGGYACIINFNAYRIEDNAYIGRAAAQVVLYVLGWETGEMERETREKYTDPEETGRPPSGFAPSKPAGRRKKPPRKKWQYAAGLLVLGIFCTARAAGGVHLSQVKGPEKPEGLAHEVNIVMGDIPGKTKEERQRELNSMVGEGTIAIPISTTPSGKAVGASRGINWLVENPSNQGKLVRAEVTPDETGEKTYEIGAIPLGSYVAETPPDVKLEVGVYECTAMFYAYQEETEEYIDQAAAELKLILLE